MKDGLFYSNGLRFFCTQCSRCCRHDSGYVFLSSEDVLRLQRYFRISRDEFIHRYCRWVSIINEERLSLNEQENNDCIFWTDGGCAVYTDRPIQCRTYPFWSHVLDDSSSWERESNACPGIGIGRRISSDEIENLLLARVRNRPMRRER